jgi:hypothetical protein
METDMRKVISSYAAELQKLMDAATVPMGKQSRIDELMVDIARAAGVQPRDLHLCGEFDDDNGELVSTFVGLWDPAPGSERVLKKYEEVLEGDWQAPNSIRV